MKKVLINSGVKIYHNTKVSKLNIDKDKITSVNTASDNWLAKIFVLCAGSFSSNLIKQINLNMPLMSGKGYSISINNAQKSISRKALKDFVLSVEVVSNQIIVKTTTAAAQVVAESIDNLFFEGIAASIAGDNVVLIISYGNKEALEISKLIDSYLN